MIAHDWACFKVGGGKYNVGWPDYYCFHRRYGHRWLETKAPKGRLSPAQRIRFERLTLAGDQVFVLEDETHYMRLFKKPNWCAYR